MQVLMVAYLANPVGVVEINGHDVSEILNAYADQYNYTRHCLTGTVLELQSLNREVKSV